MRALWVLPVLVTLACTGQHIVAGEEKTEAERFAAELPGWCEEICTKLAACGDDCDCDSDACSCGSVDEDCPQECFDDMQRWAQGSDACAAVGQRFADCIEAEACKVLSTASECDTTQAESDACPRPGNPDGGDPGGDDSGSSEPPSLVGPPTTGSAVTCDASSSSGQNPAAQMGPPEILCELQYDNCSDGQERRLVCVTTLQGPTSCACRLDGVLTGAFDSGGACPTTAQQNVGCGWNIEEM